MRTSNLKWHYFKASVYILNLLDKHQNGPVTTLHGQNGVTDEVPALKLDKSELKFRLYHFIAAALVKLLNFLNT